MGIISLVMDKMVPLFGKSNGWIRDRVMVFNTTFNNISVISWRSVLLVEKNGVPGKKPLTCRKSLKLYHIILYRVHLAWAGFEFTTLVVIGTDCIERICFLANRKFTCCYNIKIFVQIMSKMYAILKKLCLKGDHFVSIKREVTPIKRLF